MSLKIRKAIILAAGKGSRLGKLTKNIPKPMLLYKNKPILEHTILNLKSSGISEIGINLHHNSKTIKDYFNDGETLGIKIYYSYERELLGTAGALYKFSNFLDNDPFILIYGDNIIDFDLKPFIDFHIKNRPTVSIHLSWQEDISMSGVVELSEYNRVTSFIEKPEQYEIKSHWVNSGIYMFEPEILKYIPENGFSDFGFDVFPKMIKNGEVILGYRGEHPVIPIDTVELYNAMKGMQ